MKSWWRADEELMMSRWAGLGCWGLHQTASDCHSQSYLRILHTTISLNGTTPRAPLAVLTRAPLAVLIAKITRCTWITRSLQIHHKNYQTPHNYHNHPKNKNHQNGHISQNNQSHQYHQNYQNNLICPVFWGQDAVPVHSTVWLCEKYIVNA